MRFGRESRMPGAPPVPLPFDWNSLSARVLSLTRNPFPFRLSIPSPVVDQAQCRENLFAYMHEKLGVDKDKYGHPAASVSIPSRRASSHTLRSLYSPTPRNYSALMALPLFLQQPSLHPSSPNLAAYVQRLPPAEREQHLDPQDTASYLAGRDGIQLAV